MYTKFKRKMYWKFIRKMCTKVIRSMYRKNVKFQLFGFHYFWAISKIIFLNKKERSKLRFNDTRKL